MKADPTSSATIAQPGRTSWGVKVLAFALMLVVTLVAAELAAQAFYAFIVSPQLEARKVDPGHYYRASHDPLLGYELAPGFRVRRDERDLMINSVGLRGPELAASKPAARFAVLGDSVTFSLMQGEAHTIPRLVEGKLRRDCGPSVEVLNLGVPGYGAHELNELLRTKATALSLDGVIYLLNLNDFAQRDSIWEGADSGLYRMYAPPALKLPFLLQKAFYRWHKGAGGDGTGPSLEWYRWLINGTWSETLDQVSAMNLWAKNQGIGFSVSILPSGFALAGGENALAAEHRRIGEALRARQVPFVDDVRPLIGAGLYDETDHMTDKGNDVISAQLGEALKSFFPAVAAKSGCRPNA